jgi:uncharacterized protein (TIGR00255 family)
MGIHSMTGFARTTGTALSRAFAWEIRAVNGRSLDVKLRTPPGLDVVGEEARKRLSARMARGTVHVTLTLAAADTARGVSINVTVLQSLIEALGRVETHKGIGPATLDGLLGVRGVIETTDEDPLAQVEGLKTPLLAAFDEAMAAFLESRASEGAALSRVLTEQLDRIASLTAEVEAHPARGVEATRARLASQIALVMGASNGLDPARLHQEAMLLATKADVREELDRLVAHIASARDLLTQGGAAGRRLDFLSQEFGREASTLCAKANDVALSRIGLELRAIVDQMREQVQNVE